MGKFKFEVYVYNPEAYMSQRGRFGVRLGRRFNLVVQSAVRKVDAARRQKAGILLLDAKSNYRERSKEKVAIKTLVCLFSGLGVCGYKLVNLLFFRVNLKSCGAIKSSLIIS
jgi:hypothetical protein